MPKPEVTFLKLGGSLITDKNKANTPRRRTLARLAREIAAARAENPNLHLILGHGSGSFGHHAAHQHQTHLGVHTQEEWQGFVHVWQAARMLNQIVVETLSAAGLPVVAFPASAMILTQNVEVICWDLFPIHAALNAGLIPLVQGDVVFDIHLGGTILSTEKSFEYLACRFPTRRILLAGIEKGVWSDYPTCHHLVKNIRPDNYAQTVDALDGSAAIDVTGGMAQKVESMLMLAEMVPGLEALIFTGEKPGLVYRALKGQNPGTLISTLLPTDLTLEEVQNVSDPNPA